MSSATEVAEASDVPASPEAGSEETSLEELFGLDDDEDDLAAEDEGEEPESEDEDGEDVEDEDEEAEQPALEAPATFNKREKEVFSQLPADLQSGLVEIERRRAQDVQRATTEAAQARQTASEQALAEVVQIQRAAADELAIYAEYLSPMEPDLALLATDPEGFAAQATLAKQMSAISQEIRAKIDAMRSDVSQADQYLTALAGQKEAELLRHELPEWFDAQKRAELIPIINEVGAEMGYTPEALAKADARDVIALKKVADWRTKAQKWDKSQQSLMANVRAARGKPKVAMPGVSRSRAEAKASREDSAWQRAKSATDRSSREAAFGEFLEARGII